MCLRESRLVCFRYKHLISDMKIVASIVDKWSGVSTWLQIEGVKGRAQMVLPQSLVKGKHMRRSSWSCKSILSCSTGVIKRDLAFKNTGSIVRTIRERWDPPGKARKESVCSHADPPGEVCFNLEIVRDGNNSWETALNGVESKGSRNKRCLKIN